MFEMSKFTRLTSLNDDRLRYRLRMVGFNGILSEQVAAISSMKTAHQQHTILEVQ